MQVSCQFLWYICIVNAALDIVKATSGRCRWGLNQLSLLLLRLFILLIVNVQLFNCLFDLIVSPIVLLSNVMDRMERIQLIEYLLCDVVG